MHGRRRRKLFKKIPLRVHKIKKQKVRKEALTEMEIERLRMAADGEMQKMMIEVLLSTGCRVTELVNIRIDEIQKDEITVHGKGEKDRKVYLNAKAELAAQVYLAKRRDENPYLLPGAKNMRERKGMDRKESRKNWWMDRNNLTEGHITTSAVESTMRTIADRAEVEQANPAQIPAGHAQRLPCGVACQLNRCQGCSGMRKSVRHRFIWTSRKKI